MKLNLYSLYNDLKKTQQSTTSMVNKIYKFYCTLKFPYTYVLLGQRSVFSTCSVDNLIMETCVQCLVLWKRSCLPNIFVTF